MRIIENKMIKKIPKEKKKTDRGCNRCKRNPSFVKMSGTDQRRRGFLSLG